jgi:hypothetical protein
VTEIAELVANCFDSMFRPSQRDCSLQPKVAEPARLPWVTIRTQTQPQRGCGECGAMDGREWSQRNCDLRTLTQGSSCLATPGLGLALGWNPVGIPSVLILFRSDEFSVEDLQQLRRHDEDFDEHLFERLFAHAEKLGSPFVAVAFTMTDTVA